MSLFKNIKNFLSSCFNSRSGMTCRIISVNVDNYIFPIRGDRSGLQARMKEAEYFLLRAGMNAHIKGEKPKAEICFNLSEKWLRLSFFRYYKDERYDDFKPIPLTPLDRLSDPAQLAAYFMKQLGKRGITFEDKVTAMRGFSVLSGLWIYQMNNPGVKIPIEDRVRETGPK